MRRVALALVFVCALFARAGAQVGYDPDFVMGASDGERFWMLARSLDGRDAPVTVFVAPPGMELGALRRVSGMREAPEMIAATSGGLVSVFAPAEGASVRRVREQRFVEIGSAGARAGAGTRVLAPLPARGELVGLAEQGGVLRALLVTDGAPELLERMGDGWDLIELPPGLPGGDAYELANGTDDPTIVVRTAARESVWARTDDGWSARRVFLETGGRLVSTRGGAWLRVRPQGNGFVVSRTVGAGETPDDLIGSPLSVMSVPAVAASLPLGDALAFVWPEGDGTMAVRMRVVGFDGQTRYDGLAEMRGPVSPADIQALALVMLAMCLLVVVFVVRPGEEREPFLPDGYALATPLRRSAGWLIDALPGVLIALAIWPELIGEPGTFFSTRGPGGPLPWGLVAASFVVHATVCEALFGRTLGKLVLGMRTITYDGDRPTWWMAFSRNVVRGVFPPLAIMSAMNPTMVHPQSFQTLVVVRYAELEAPGGGKSSG